MGHGPPGLLGLAARTIVAHTTTYVLMGILAVSVLDYEALFALPSLGLVMGGRAGP